MFNQLLGFLFLFMFQFCMAADDSVAKFIPAEAISWAENAWSSGILGVVLITLGLFLTFAGKRWFKIFLGASGFLTFGVLGWSLVAFVNEMIFNVPHIRYVTYAVA